MPQIEKNMAEMFEPNFDAGRDRMPLAESLEGVFAHWKIICGTTVAAMAAAVAAALFLPNWYKAEAVIMPPQQQQSSLASIAANPLGGLAAVSMAGGLGIKNPSDLYIGILESRTISDDIASRFHLAKVYGSRLNSETRKALAKHSSFSSGKDSLIRITFEDRDRKRAAAVANAFVDELYDANSRLALTDAAQRRLFFERELAKEKDSLADSEIALKQTQQKTGLVVPTGQAELLIRSGAQLRAEIASREVQLQAMRSYATDENPQIQVLKREIAALQSELDQLQAKNDRSGFEMSAGQLPDATLEYIRRMRELKYHETLYELLARQYEAARIDEAKQAPVIQIVDPAVAPDKKSWPPRAMIVAAVGLLAFALCLGGVILAERIAMLRRSIGKAAPHPVPASLLPKSA